MSVSVKANSKVWILRQHTDHEFSETRTWVSIRATRWLDKSIPKEFLYFSLYEFDDSYNLDILLLGWNTGVSKYDVSAKNEMGYCFSGWNILLFNQWVEKVILSVNLADIIKNSS